ncbi:MAG: aminopeptidase [Phycisphaerae bacterium]|nr:aminopeptidase [Phycisphaerae bacterium]
MTSSRHCARLSTLAFALVTAVSCGCEGMRYVLHVADGQFAVQGGAEPIEEVLASGRLSEDEEVKLRLIVKAREFAAETIGLDAGNSYTEFYDTEDVPLAYNLSAARRDALVAKTWTFPILGQVPYLMFFDEGYLRELEGQLSAEGFDTMTYELDAYSTLGIFEDPVRSPMLRRHVLSLIETIIHELLHNTIWRPNETEFNESLATFVGRSGAVEFLRLELGDDSGWPEAAEDYYADVDAVNAFLLGLYADLEEYYAQPLSSEEKVAGREAVFQAARERFATEVQPRLNYPESFAYPADLPTNNAWVLMYYRYNLDLGVLEEVHQATGRDWSATLAVFRAAAADPGDPFAYLRDWLAEEER